MYDFYRANIQQKPRIYYIIGNKKQLNLQQLFEAGQEASKNKLHSSPNGSDSQSERLGLSVRTAQTPSPNGSDSQAPPLREAFGLLTQKMMDRANKESKEDMIVAASLILDLCKNRM